MNTICQDHEFIFSGHEFSKNDHKRLKKIQSIKEDVEAHFKVVRGRAFEILRIDDYSGSLGAFLCKHDIGDGCMLYFYKDRWKITNPPSKGTKDGYRIIFALFQNNNDVFVYLPMLVYIANEEKSFIKEGGKRIKLTKQGIKDIINERVPKK